jgi:eukaryotic-like serine/threonine-protein kinase
MMEHGVKWQRVREVFEQVADLHPAEWERAVAEHAGADVALGAEVLELLRSLEEAGDRFELPAPADLLGLQEPADITGALLGPYRLLREVGSGGMGTVYEARRADDQFEQRVAVKLLRRCVGDDALVRRFGRERRILAALDHPGICRLLDAGVTTDGRPYLVMEYIEGLPITTYCDDHELDTRQRLDLFRAVCAAVSHAHRHLVVHRDLKPGNILVTSDGMVKLLDFGIARLLPDHTSGGAALDATATAVRSFTPAYASPEQLRGDPVSTATDVYSLGVVLYELLTGLHPYSVESRDPLELVRLHDTEPVRPSYAVTERAGPAAADGRSLRLRRMLAGELDNIVLMAMRREPARRYASVEQLSEDLFRYAAGRPVLAQRDTVGYRVRKFVWRNRVGVAAAALVFLTLIGGMTATASQARRANEERDRARLETAKAERISAFMTGLLRAADPWMDGRDVRVVDLLEGAAERSRAELAGESDVLAEALSAIGLSYAGLGFYDEAESLLEQVLRIRRERDPSSPRLAAATGNLGGVLLARGDLDRAEPLLLDALALLKPATRQDSIQLADLLGSHAQLLQARGDMAAAASQVRAVLALRQRLLGPRHADVAASLNNLAVVLGQLGDFAGAESMHREALDIQLAAGGPEHPDVASAMSNLAFVLTELKQYPAADSFYRAALALRQRVLGPEHPDVGWTMYSHASLHLATGDCDSALDLAARVLALRGRTLPDQHPVVASTLHVLGRCHVAQGRPDLAEGPLRESLALRAAALPPDHWLQATAASVLGECLTGLRRFQEAEPLLLDGYDRLVTARGVDHPRTREAADRLVRHYTARADTARARLYR